HAGTGEPLPGVSVSVKGEQATTQTDDQGDYQLTVSPGTTLVFRLIGYADRELVTSEPVLNVTLTETSSELEEVVVVGYNTVKKSDLTGAVASIGAEQVRRMPVANALQAMQGMVSGVDITSNERPGQMGSVLVRGVRSLSAGNSPLYVVDGIPLTAGGIEALNPSDIESIDVLKDASATAIYGSRGANGVIMISTKRGE